MREKLRDLSELVFHYYYFEIMYFTLLIFSVSLLSYFNPQKQVTYFIILGIHFLSIYLYNYIGEVAEIIVSNFILFVLTICFHVFIPVVLAVALSLITSFTLAIFSDKFIVEEGTVFIGEKPTKEEKIFNILKKRSVRFIIKFLLLFLILLFFALALYLNGFSFSTNIKLFIGYIVADIIIIFFCEQTGFCLEDCFYDFRDIFNYFLD